MYVCIAAEGPLIQNNQQWLERPWLNYNVKIVQLKLFLLIYLVKYLSIYQYFLCNNNHKIALIMQFSNVVCYMLSSKYTR